MKRKITQLFLVFVCSLGISNAYTAEAPIATAVGVIRALDFGTNTMVVNGTQYRVAIDVQVDLGNGYGAFTMLEDGWNVEFDYKVYSGVEREIVRLRRIPDNFVIEEV
jgi:hypothetical protein